MGYILGIDQSTQGTKTILVDARGRVAGRADRPHRQIVNEKGWVSHDLEEIYRNVIAVTRDLLDVTGVAPSEVTGIGISNQRETTAIWDRSGRPLNEAVVWQCSRAAQISDALSEHAEIIRERTGLRLSPYFPAAKMSWLITNTSGLDDYAPGEYCLGTIDSYLVYRLTGGDSFRTDYSNASRTQLMNLHTLEWDRELCDWFHVPYASLPEITDSNADYGHTNMEGLFCEPIPIHAVLGDSHAALYGQGCQKEGMIKATYGTGSSIMMNVGSDYVNSSHGLVTSLAWGIDGHVDYVLEGNINYTGAVISWLKDDVRLIGSAGESEICARAANPQDTTILVPAFSGLSAPYWKNHARALIYGMSRTTGRNEIVKAALDSIAYQIQSVLDAMQEDSHKEIQELRVDGGPTRNAYLMQLQSDLCGVRVRVPESEELSAIGAAYLAGESLGVIHHAAANASMSYTVYEPRMQEMERLSRLRAWDHAVRCCE